MSCTRFRIRAPFSEPRIDAIGLTILLTLIVTSVLPHCWVGMLWLPWPSGSSITVSWRLPRPQRPDSSPGFVATALLALTFAVIYYWAPDVKARRWHWITPGGAIGILGWLIASLGFRVYIHFFNSFSITYGSLGAVIILLTWFYITGLMLLVGAEIDSEIEAAAAETRIASLPMRSVVLLNGEE
jgi:membrane protein